MSGFWKAVSNVGKKVLKKQKTTGTEVVNPFQYKSAKSDIDKKIKDITVSVHKLKGRKQGIYQKMQNKLEEVKKNLKKD